MNISQHEKYLCGLALYMSQVQLSIHRSSWLEFSRYAAASMVSIDKVIEHGAMLGLSTSLDAGMKLAFPQRGWFSRCIIRRTRNLRREEIDYIFLQLKKMKLLLEGLESAESASVRELRLNLAYSAGIISDHLRAARKLNMKVTHLNESEHIATSNIDELLGFEWL